MPPTRLFPAPGDTFGKSQPCQEFQERSECNQRDERIIKISHVSDLGAQISLGEPKFLAQPSGSRYILSPWAIRKMLFGSKSTHQRCALREQMSPRGPSHKTALDERAGAAPAVPAAPSQGSPWFWKAEQQEGCRTGALLPQPASCPWLQHLATPAGWRMEL